MRQKKSDKDSFRVSLPRSEVPVFSLGVQTPGLKDASASRLVFASNQRNPNQPEANGTEHLRAFGGRLVLLDKPISWLAAQVIHEESILKIWRP